MELHLATPRGDVPLKEAAQPASVSPWRTFQSATRAGVPVSHGEAMGISAFWACVMLIAKTAGSLPLDTLDDRRAARTVVGGADVALRLKEQPNSAMTGVQFWTTVFANRAATGNAYLVTLPATDELGKAPELWPLPSVYVNPWRAQDGGALWYRYTTPETGRVVDIPGSQIIHMAGPSLGSGLVGASPVETLRERLGVSLAASRYQARFFQNDARPRGVLSVQESLPEDAAAMIRDQWHAIYGGVENSHQIAVLDHGASYQPIGISPDDAQFMEQMQFAATEIARVFGVPPGMIGADGASLTYTNAQQNDQHFLKFTLRPYLREAEAALNRNPTLFGVRSPWRPEFNVADVLRPDVVTHHAMLREDVSAGLLNLNEARLQIGLDVIEGADQQAPDRTLEYRLTAAVSAGLVTLNEAREQLGLPPVAGGDELREPEDASGDELVGRAQPNITFTSNIPEHPAPDVTINVPEQRAPQVTVENQPADVTVNVPEQRSPDVTVNVPEQPAPEVHVDVAAPEVRVEPKIEVEQAAQETPDHRRALRFHRGADGRIVGAEWE